VSEERIDTKRFSICIPTKLCIELDMLVDKKQKVHQTRFYRQDLIEEAIENFIKTEKGVKTVREEIEDLKGDIKYIKSKLS